MDARKPLRVAIVEDDLAARNILVSALQRDADYTVVAEFAEGTAAICAIPNLAPDMVLVDLGLPDISGIEVIRELKSTYGRGCDFGLVSRGIQPPALTDSEVVSREFTDRLRVV